MSSVRSLTFSLVSLAALLDVSALALGGCSASSSVAPDPGCAPFIAQEPDFYNYHGWTTYREDSGLVDSVPAPTADGGTAVVHNAGLRIEYINKTPPHGATEFPIGTIIVKEIPSQMQVFAMVKRGGSCLPAGLQYNAYDAGTGLGVYSNWEWYELIGSQDDVEFLWFGLPPANQAYSGNNPYVCNECHSAMGRGNDFVASPEIRLERY